MRLPTHRRPTTPGEMLIEEFLKPLSISQTDFAKRINVTYARLNEIIHGKRGVSPDTALRFSQALGTSAELWLNLQRSVELYDAVHSDKIRDIKKIKRIVAVK